jgi:hypothetical protein
MAVQQLKNQKAMKQETLLREAIERFFDRIRSGLPIEPEYGLPADLQTMAVTDALKNRVSHFGRWSPDDSV